MRGCSLWSPQIYGCPTHTAISFLFSKGKPAAVARRECALLPNEYPQMFGILDAVFSALHFKSFTLLCSALLCCHMGKWFCSPNKYKSDRILFRPSSLHAALIALALSKWMRKKNTNSDSIKSKQTIENRIEINTENNITLHNGAIMIAVNFRQKLQHFLCSAVMRLVLPSAMNHIHFEYIQCRMAIKMPVFSVYF